MTSIAAPSTARRLPRSPIPGFPLAMGFTLFWLALIVLIPLAGVFDLEGGELSHRQID